MNFLDLFSGIGGFRLGLERAGHTPVGWVEIDKFARQSYQAIHDTTGEWTAEDITKVTDEEWREFNGKVDIIAGGFPCQAFSIAGKRMGFLDSTKVTLFFDVARAAKQIKPRYLFLENVKGLLNHDSGNTFRTILNTLDELGYDVEWHVLNSKDFGVPQNRERVYIIGHLRGYSGREVFPFFGEEENFNKNKVIQTYQLNTPTRKNSNRFRTYSKNGIAPCLSTMQGGGLEPCLSIGDKIRKLTPLECWRLQAFPDWAFNKAKEAGLSDSQLYKQAGNSVTVNVIEAIAKGFK